jgi:hypothetical protein
MATIKILTVQTAKSSVHIGVSATMDGYAVCFKIGTNTYFSLIPKATKSLANAEAKELHEAFKKL